jgi:mRNA interferase YafQ
LSKFAVRYSGQFKKDVRRVAKRGKNLEKLKTIIKRLAIGGTLEAKHRDHSLGGNYANHRECHIEPDWLFIYMLDEDASELILTATRTGSHADLF